MILFNYSIKFIILYFISIVHCHSYSRYFEIVDFMMLGFLPLWSECEHKFTLALHYKVCGTVLITKGVTSYNDRLTPPRHKPRNITNQDGLSKHSSVQDIPDCTIRGFPHLLQLELSYSILIGSDGCAFNTHLATFYGLSSVYRDLIIREISVFNG